MRVRLIKLLDVTTTASRSLVNPAALTSSFSTTSHAFKKATQMPARPSLPDSELHHVYLKGSGPGGQKINKTNSACQLTHIPTGIVVKSQATRSRSQNHNIARRILAEKVELLEKGDESRIAIKTAAASKKKASKRKKALRKYRKLGEGKEDDEASEDDVGEDKAWDESGMKAEEAPHNERHDANQIECGSGAEVQAVNQVKKKKTPEMA